MEQIKKELRGELMPYKTFNNWLFDGMLSTDIPKPQDNIDILKYNSPITHTFVLQLFLRNGSLNHYLNEVFNNIGLRYLTKEDLFLFIKKCVIDFRVNRRDIVFYPFRHQDKLYNVLRQRVPELKNNDISLLCEIIDRSDEKDVIYETLGLGKPPKKQKIKIGKKKTDKKSNISLKKLLEEHFSVMET